MSLITGLTSFIKATHSLTEYWQAFPYKHFWDSIDSIIFSIPTKEEEEKEKWEMLNWNLDSKGISNKQDDFLVIC